MYHAARRQPRTPYGLADDRTGRVPSGRHAGSEYRAREDDAFRADKAAQPGYLGSQPTALVYFSQARRLTGHDYAGHDRWHIMEIAATHYTRHFSGRDITN